MVFWWIQFISWIWKRIPSAPPQFCASPENKVPTELLFNQRLFYMIIVIIRQHPAHHLSPRQGRTRRHCSPPFTGTWKKSEAVFGGCLLIRKGRGSSPLLLTAQRPKGARRSSDHCLEHSTPITNGDEICINICVLGGIAHTQRKRPTGSS